MLPLAQGIRRHGHGAAEAPERAEKGKRPTEKSCGGVELGEDDLGGGKGKFLSPARRRECVKRVRDAMNASERRVCAVVGQNRATNRYTSSVNAYPNYAPEL